MIFNTIDSIVRRGLLEKRLPMHYYIEYLCHAASCLRELNIDTLRIINAVRLPVNRDHSVDLPDDFQDALAVSISTGGNMWPIPQRPGINRLRNIDQNTGEYVSYPTTFNNNSLDVFGFNPSWLWFWNINDYGEPTGRFFGAYGGDFRGWLLVKERQQIQLSGAVTDNAIQLLYISNGQSVDNASQIDTSAIATIHAYIGWKSSPNMDRSQSAEANNYWNQRRLLRARMNELTVVDIKDTIRGNYRATIKT